MDIPYLLPILLALPLIVGGVIVAVSVARRRGRAPMAAATSEPAHRLQADTAAVQDSTVHAPAAPPAAVPGRTRRAAAAARER